MGFFTSILAVLAALLADPKVPEQDASSVHWRSTPTWQEDGNRLRFQAESTDIVKQCQNAPNRYLSLPLVIQGVQLVQLDGRLVYATGDIALERGEAMYNLGSIACRDLIAGETLSWTVLTRTKTLANLTRFPMVTSGQKLRRFFFETLIVAVGGALPIVGLLSLFLFGGRVERAKVASLTAACCSFSIFFCSQHPDSFGLTVSSFDLHRFGDIANWTGCVFLARFFAAMHVLKRRVAGIFYGLYSLAIGVILVAEDLDQSQVGSTIGLITGILMCAYITTTVWTGYRKDPEGRTIRGLQALALLCFAFTGTNEILLASATIDGMSVFSVGVLACVCFLFLAVNQQIADTYRERDYLRQNLEREVAQKTEDLEQSLVSLRKAQAEIVQSAKLAALGTMSAGIAHEINNSLNYVNGAIRPLVDIIEKDALTDNDRNKGRRLTGLMREGLDLTFKIIQNLKRQAATDAGDFEEVDIAEAVRGLLVLLRSKLNDAVSTDIQIEDGMRLSAIRVSFTQIVMNLVANAVDAMEGQAAPKRIIIAAKDHGAHVSVTVQDSGPGVPPAIRERIFDPFFTTKAVGKGTGLGLHIVYNEVQRHGGKLTLEDAPSGGAIFRVDFPRASERRKSA